MSIIKTASSIPRAALIYFTAGALTVVWSGIWYVYVLNNPTSSETLYWCYGFMLTGVTLALIGLAIGWVARIRRSGDDVQRPRVEVASAGTHPEPIAAAMVPTLAVLMPTEVTGGISPNNGIAFVTRPASQAELAESTNQPPRLYKSLGEGP